MGESILDCAGDTCDLRTVTSALDKSCDEIHLPNIGVSAKHKENVSYVHRLFKNNKFQDYLQAGRIVFDTYQEAHSVIENTDFGESVEYSSLGSHKSMKDYDIDTIMRLSNDAVIVCYATVSNMCSSKNRAYDSNELAKMGIF